MLDLNNTDFSHFLIVLATARVIFQWLPIPWERLPLAEFAGKEQSKRIHNYGFYVSLGYLVFASLSLLTQP